MGSPLPLLDVLEGSLSFISTSWATEGVTGRTPNAIKSFQPRNPFTWRLKTQTSGGLTVILI